MASRIWIYSDIQVIVSVPIKAIFSEVPKIKIGPILCFLGLYIPLVDYVYDLLWHGVLSTLAPFEDVPGLQKNKFVGPDEVNPCPGRNLLLCSRIHGVGRV